MTSVASVAAAFAIILLDLGVRAGLDKTLALSGTPALVALWAQLQSVVDLVSGVALAGVTQGLTVLIAQARDKREEGGLLRAALKLAPGVAAAVALLFVLASPWLALWLTHGRLEPDILALAALIGCIAVVPAILSAYWLGHHRQQRVLQLALFTSLPLLAVVAGVPAGLSLRGLALLQCLALLCVALPVWRYLRKLAGAVPDRAMWPRLAQFIPVGLAIGIMSPVSMLLVRGMFATSLSWNDAGVMQALWRSAEWVTGTSAGVLSLIFMPRLSATNGTPRFAGELRRAALAVLLPAALLLLLIYLNQRAMLATLYDARFSVSDEAAALFMLGSLVRVASWIFLFGLYASRRTRLISLGEVLSIPLFALLMWLFTASMSLELAALLYCMSYLVYLAYNAIALRLSLRVRSLA